ncbi:hypothetical protein ABID42_004721 [Arcicella rosea]|uniref:BACON domain-containing protein n=1 Tax=Arcicella rosea TaxID=502909 RepID=UPI00345CB530
MKLKYFYLVLSLFLTIFSKESLAQFEQTTITEYENKYFQVKKTRTQNSDGSWNSTSYKYAFNYPSSNSTIHTRMVEHNMVSKVIEEVVSLEWYDNGVLDNSKTETLFTTLTTYTDTLNAETNPSGLVVPTKIERKIGSGVFQPIVTFLKYDGQGNLTEYKAKDGLTNKYSYYTSSGKANLVEYHKNNADQETQYDYYPLVGLKSVKDINKNTSNYTYDSFNRLKSVSDHVGALKEYSYHYADQDIENPLESFTVTTADCRSCGTNLDLNQSNWNPSKDASTFSVIVSSNISWTASSNASWLTVSPGAGTNNGTLTLTAIANSGTSRTGTITVSGEGLTKTVTVTQSGTTASVCPVDEVVVGKQGDADVVIKHFDNYYILCTKSVSGTGVIRYVPRGKNYWTWSGFVKNSNVEQYQSCINVNDSDWWGLANPLPSGYVPTGWSSSTFNDTEGNPIFYFYQNTVPPTLSLSSPTWSPSASSGSTTVSVNSNVSWTASSNEGWLSVSPTSGSNNVTLTLTATANSGSSRTGTITVTGGGGLTQTVTVNQAAGVSGGVNVVSNGNCYTIKSKQTNNYMQLMGDGTIQQQVANNQSTQIWKAVSSGSSYQFVSQSNQQYLKVDNYNDGTLVTSGTTGYNLWNLVNTAGSYQVSSPTSYTWDMAGGGSLPHLQLWGRSDHGFSDFRLWIFTQATCSVTVPPSLTVSPNSWSAGASSGSTTVSVNSNVSWTASSNEGWLSVSPTSGSNNVTLTLTATANSGSSRTGTITVTGGGGLTQTVTVNQAAGVSGGVNVVSNGNCYTIKSKQTNNYMQLMGDGTIQQQVANNQSTQIWKAVSSGSSYQFVSQSNQQYLKVDNYNDGTLVTSGTTGYNLWNLVNTAGSYQVSSPTSYTWDMAGSGSLPHLQLWGRSEHGFSDFRLWIFTQATCTATCTSPVPTLTASPTTISSGQNSTLTASGCSGTVNWSGGGTGLTKVVNSAGTYTATCTNAGCSVSQSGSVIVSNVPCPTITWSTSNSVSTCNGTATFTLRVSGLSSGQVAEFSTDGTNFQTSNFDNGSGFIFSRSTINSCVGFWARVKNCTDASKTIWGCIMGNGNPCAARVSVGNDVFEKQEEVKEDVLVVSPNPTEGNVKASFHLREAQAVRLSVIDTQGRTISIYDKDADAGTNSIDLDLQQQASGTYIIQLQLKNKQLVSKVVKQ